MNWLCHGIYIDLHFSLSVGRSSNSVSKVNGLSATGCEENGRGRRDGSRVKERDRFIYLFGPAA